MKFWDSSALIPLCCEESNTPLVKKILEDDSSIVVWWNSVTECDSAFARLRREAVLTTDQERMVRHLVDLLAQNWTEILPSQMIRDQVGRLLLLHPLRAADSLQLAAALLWAQGFPKNHAFVCLDTRLREAAMQEGFIVLPESLI